MSNIEKNKQIKKTLAETRERRKSQKCFVFSTKIDYSKLNKLQKEQLQMLFVEGKWVYNDILNFLNNGGKLSKYNTKRKPFLLNRKMVSL